MANGKDMIIHLIAGLIKKKKKILNWKKFRCIKMSQHFPKSYESFGGDIDFKLDFSNYATKSNLKNPPGIDTSKLAAKADFVV